MASNTYKMKKTLIIVVQNLINLFCIMLRVFPVNSKRIFIMSYHGANFSGNPKYIAQYIKQHHPEYELIIGYHTKLSGYKTVKPTIFNLKYLFYVVTSKIWIDNCRKTFPIYKRKNQIYIQTWHGTPLKKIEFDVEHALSELYLRGARIDSNQIDYFVSPNKFLSDLIPNTFQYSGKILECGYPRNDILVNTDAKVIEDIKKKLNLPLDKKIILYGPTFRDGGKNDNKFSTGMNLDFDEFIKAFKEDYILLLRLHSNVSNQIKMDNSTQQTIYNVSKYDDVQELLAIADILITDYSSLFFDFASTKRPIIFYAHDLELYRDKLRGFYFEYESFVPGKIAYTSHDLFEILTHMDTYYNTEYFATLERFRQAYTTFETGHASETITNLIVELTNTHKK